MAIRVASPILDKIVFLLPWDIDPRVDKAKIDKLNTRLQKLIDKGDCEFAHIKGSRYFVRFRVILPGGHKVLVQLGAFDQSRNKGGLRIELNPSQMEKGDAAFFRGILRRVLAINTQRLRELFVDAVINKLHVAVDVHGIDLRRVLVYYQYAEKLSVICKRLNKAGLIEGYNFGAKGSDYQAAVYDKKTERIHRAVEALLRAGRSADESLKANRVTQFYTAKGVPERMRVEVRGQKLRGMALHNVGTLSNRFAWFHFIDLNAEGSDLPPILEQAFVSMCRDIGAAAALKAFKGSRQVRKINAFWRSRQAAWWQPERMWGQVDGLLKATNLFPPEAFVAP
ncbi:hypothetical protein [Comamonas sp. 4034]|uniref:hypothetical protein n=1 Tax=Comamonas sp. 4034 TaxID=3156455 RepID=UPI003D1D4513